MNTFKTNSDEKLVLDYLNQFAIYKTINLATEYTLLVKMKIPNIV